MKSKFSALEGNLNTSGNPSTDIWRFACPQGNTSVLLHSAIIMKLLYSATMEERVTLLETNDDNDNYYINNDDDNPMNTSFDSATSSIPLQQNTSTNVMMTENVVSTVSVCTPGFQRTGGPLSITGKIKSGTVQTSFNGLMKEKSLAFNASANSSNALQNYVDMKTAELKATQAINRMNSKSIKMIDIETQMQLLSNMPHDEWISIELKTLYKNYITARAEHQQSMAEEMLAEKQSAVQKVVPVSILSVEETVLQEAVLQDKDDVEPSKTMVASDSDNDNA